jgi:hypothetical protein
MLNKQGYMHTLTCTRPRARAPTLTHSHAHTHTHTQICNTYCFSTATIIRERPSILLHNSVPVVSILHAIIFGRAHFPLCLYAGVKVTAAWTWTVLPSSVKIKNRWRYTSNSIRLYGLHGNNFFPVIIVLFTLTNRGSFAVVTWCFMFRFIRKRKAHVSWVHA